MPLDCCGWQRQGVGKSHESGGLHQRTDVLLLPIASYVGSSENLHDSRRPGSRSAHDATVLVPLLVGYQLRGRGALPRCRRRLQRVCLRSQTDRQTDRQNARTHTQKKHTHTHTRTHTHTQTGSVMKTIRQPVYGPLAGLSAKSEQYGVMEVTSSTRWGAPALCCAFVRSALTGRGSAGDIRQ